MNLPFAGRSQRPPDPHGQRVEADMSRSGTLDTGSNAWPERLLEARRAWPEARSEDFEQVDRRGRLFRDRATNTVYRRLSGAPILDIGSEATRGVSCFFVRGGEIIVLRPSDFPVELRGPSGGVYSQQLTAATPGPELRIH